MTEVARQAGELSSDGLWRWDGERWVGQPLPAGGSRGDSVAVAIADLRTARPATWAVLPVAAVVGALTDLALHATSAGLAAALLLVTICAGLVASRRVVNRHGVAALGLAALLGAFLAVRQSPWLLVPDVVVALGLVLLACGLTTEGSLLDLSFARAQAQGIRAMLHLLGGIPYAVTPLRAAFATIGGERRAVAAAAARGLLIAIPVVLLLGWLLAQADAVFASFFTLRSDPLDWIGHVLLFALGAATAVGLMRAASAVPMGPLPRAWRFGGIETLVVLVALDLVFATFTVAQVVAATGGGAAAIRSQGLTYAEYAHSGFFQLLWVAGLTLVLLLTVRAFVNVGEAVARRAYLVAAELAIMFTLLIVAVAFQRLSLYVSVYGLSMLRLYCLVFAGWIALVYLALGVSLLGAGGRRQWFPAAIALTGIVGLLALNVADPEAIVTRYNLAATQQTQRFDPDYLVTLSADAIPALAEAMPTMAPGARATVHDRVCGGPAFRAPDWAALNWSDVAADAARARAC
jgi:two-component system, OmpR family, sensor histidine kinase BaeS